MATKSEKETKADESTEVAVKAPAGLEGLSQEDLDDLRTLQDDFQEELNLKDDIRLPQIILIQNTNIPDDVEGARPGRFYHTGSSMIAEEVEIVVARLVKTRTRFGRELGQPPLCSSPDAKNGYGDPGDDLEVRGPNGGGACAACPEAKPGASCKLQFNYVSLAVGADGNDIPWERSLPVTITMKSTSIKTAQRLNALLMEADFLPQYSIILSATQEENEKGKYYVYRMRRGRLATSEMVQKAVSISRDMKRAQEQQRGLAVEEVGTAPRAAKPAGDDGEIPF
jgi:hypothetical protein